jgi:hypothetical protein
MIHTDTESRSKRQSRIKQISKDILELTTELNSLLLEENTEGDQGAQDFVEGEEVVITNTHKGLQGKEGTIVSVSKQQVSIKLHTGPIVRRAKNNVTRK